MSESKEAKNPNKLILFLLRCAGKLLQKLNYGGIARLGSFLGACMWYFLPARRKEATRTIEKRLILPAQQATILARQSFGHNARSFMEIALASGFHLQNNPKLAPLSPSALAFIQETRPVVAATAHLGAWELLAGIMGDIFPGRPRQVVVRSQRNPSVGAYIAELRGVSGAQSVGHRNAAPKVLQCLKQNGVTAFLVDHNSSRAEALFLPFLGHTAAVNAGPAILALRGKAIIYPVFLLRGADGLYHLEAKEPLDTTVLQGNIHERVLQIATFYTAQVEAMVRQYPEQWFWMHRRWKTQPRV